MEARTRTLIQNTQRALCLGGVAALAGLTGAAWACGGGAPAPEQGTAMTDTPYTSNLRVMVRW
jgi:hypothetical protein